MDHTSVRAGSHGEPPGLEKGAMMSGSQEDKPRKNVESGVSEVAPPKRPYVKPDLYLHGTVERITENTNRGNANDGSGISQQYYSR